MLFKNRKFHCDNDWLTTFYNSRYTTSHTMLNNLSVPHIISEHSRQSTEYNCHALRNGPPNSFRATNVHAKRKLKIFC